MTLTRFILHHSFNVLMLTLEKFVKIVLKILNWLTYSGLDVLGIYIGLWAVQSLVLHKTRKDSSVWKNAMFLPLGEEGGEASTTRAIRKSCSSWWPPFFHWGYGNRSNFGVTVFIFGLLCYTKSGENQVGLNILCSY